MQEKEQKLSANARKIENTADLPLCLSFSICQVGLMIPISEFAVTRRNDAAHRKGPVHVPVVNVGIGWLTLWLCEEKNPVQIKEKGQNHLSTLKPRKWWNKDKPVRGLDLSNWKQIINLPDHGAVHQKYRSVQGSLIQRGHSIIRFIIHSSQDVLPRFQGKIYYTGWFLK